VNQRLELQQPPKAYAFMLNVYAGHPPKKQDTEKLNKEAERCVSITISRYRPPITITSYLLENHLSTEKFKPALICRASLIRGSIKN